MNNPKCDTKLRVFPTSLLLNPASSLPYCFILVRDWNFPLSSFSRQFFETGVYFYVFWYLCVIGGCLSLFMTPFFNRTLSPYVFQCTCCATILPAVHSFIWYYTLYLRRYLSVQMYHTFARPETQMHSLFETSNHRQLLYHPPQHVRARCICIHQLHFSLCHD